MSYGLITATWKSRPLTPLRKLREPELSMKELLLTYPQPPTNASGSATSTYGLTSLYSKRLKLKIESELLKYTRKSYH
jgi:hypothetical protein